MKITAVRVNEAFHQMWQHQHFLKPPNIYENEEIVVVAKFTEPVATCGEWRQGWTTLIYKNDYI
jgi:hypothetical protein